jgi:hypothetical protein
LKKNGRPIFNKIGVQNRPTPAIFFAAVKKVALFCQLLLTKKARFFDDFTPIALCIKDNGILAIFGIGIAVRKVVNEKRKYKEVQKTK